jgi:hypothetical protein
MGSREVKEYEDFVPRADLLRIAQDLQDRLYTVTAWLEDALEALENYADMGDEGPNHALSVLSSISAEINNAPFCVTSKRR